MNKKMKKLVGMLLLVVLVLGGTLTGCSSNNNNNNANSNQGTAVNEDKTQTSDATNQVAEAGETAYPITLTDSFGSQVTIEKEPQKVISIAPNISELIYKLDAADKLVGRTDYCDYPEEVTSVESIGSMSEPNIEKIVSLEPDLVVASTHFSEENLKKLQDLGIAIIELYDENSMDGVYTMIDTLGKALNRQEAAAATITDMKETVETVANKVKDFEKPTVYYVVGFGEFGDYTAGGDTFIGNLLTMSGGENIAADVSGWNYSLEGLLDKDPDIIIIGSGAGTIKDFVSANGYKDLSAVKNDKVYMIDGNLLNRQGYRNAQGLEELAKLIHPEAFK